MGCGEKKGSPYVLWVGTYIMENNMLFPKQLKTDIPYCPGTLAGVYIKENKICISKSFLYLHVY